MTYTPTMYCRKCGWKPAKEFHKAQWYCIACKKMQRVPEKPPTKERKLKLLGYARKWREKNRERIAASSRAYRLKRKESRGLQKECSNMDL